MDEAIKANEEVIARTRAFKKALAHALLTHGLPGRHTRFKDSPIGRIPEEWKVKRLGELLIRIDAGKSPKCEDRPAGPDEWGVLTEILYSNGLPFERIPEIVQRFRLSRPLTTVEEEELANRWAFYKVDALNLLTFEYPTVRLPNELTVTLAGGAL